MKSEAEIKEKIQEFADCVVKMRSAIQQEECRDMIALLEWVLDQKDN